MKRESCLAVALGILLLSGGSVQAQELKPIQPVTETYTINLDGGKSLVITGGKLSDKEMKLVSRMLAKQAQTNWQTEHPRWYVVGKYTGVNWMNAHVVNPCLAVSDKFGTEHQGTCTVVGATGGMVSAALLGVLNSNGVRKQ